MLRATTNQYLVEPAPAPLFSPVRSQWYGRLTGEEREKNQLLARIDEQRRRKQEFVEFMSEKLGKPLVCQGAACRGYIYRWDRNEASFFDYDADGFEARPCDCPHGRSVAREQERAVLKQRLLEETAKAGPTRQKLLAESNLPTEYPLGKVSLPGYFYTTNRRTLQYREVVRWVRYWPNRWPKQIREGHPFGLVLAGRYGRGKTGLAVAAGRYLIEKKGISVYFADVAEFLDEVSASWAAGKGKHHALVKRMKEADLLILDDLGDKHRNVRQNESSPLGYLFNILNSRYRRCKPVIITTNCPDEAALERAVGEGNAQRIFDICKFIEVEGENLRKGVSW